MRFTPNPLRVTNRPDEGRVMTVWCVDRECDDGRCGGETLAIFASEEGAKAYAATWKTGPPHWQASVSVVPCEVAP